MSNNFSTTSKVSIVFRYNIYFNHIQLDLPKTNAVDDSEQNHGCTISINGGPAFSITGGIHINIGNQTNQVK